MAHARGPALYGNQQREPDAQRAWEAVVMRAEAVGDTDTIARAKERIAALTKG